MSNLKHNRGLFIAAAILIALYGLYSLLLVSFSMKPGANMLLYYLPVFMRMIFYNDAVSLMMKLALPVGLLLLGIAKKRIGLGIGAAALGLIYILVSMRAFNMFLYGGHMSQVSFELILLSVRIGYLWMLLAGLILLMKPRRQMVMGILLIVIAVTVFMFVITWPISALLHVRIILQMLSGLTGVTNLLVSLAMVIGCLLIATAAFYDGVKA